MDREHKKRAGYEWEWPLIALAFVLWAFMFRGYLSGRLALVEDAISYYDHIKFFLENISRGVFPLWDPAWCSGVANSFFLQRMGCFNPFLLIALVFKAFGLSHTSSYLMYLMCYYFMGCLGFHLLAKTVIKDRLCAFVAFLLLLFSALGTRNFDSFMVLMFTPMAWFFYFLVSFCIKPRKSAFAGMFFCLIIVATTYIPFYFLLSVLTFAMCFLLLYARSFKGLLLNYLGFISAHKILTALCTALLLLSLVPGFLFFKSGGRGEYVMPQRNTSQAVGSVLGVQTQDSSNSWALLEELYFAGHYYSDVKQIKFAVIYVPLFAWVIFFLGMWVRTNRLIIFLFVWIASLLIICIPKASPVYAFLYDYIPVFKYFRNLHFYLWVTILPALCLMLAEQLKSLLAWKFTETLGRFSASLWVVAVHAAMAWSLWRHQHPAETSYFVVILSLVFFLWRIWGGLARREVLTVFLLLLIAALEPWQIYGFLSENSSKHQPYSYSYDWLPREFNYTRANPDIELVDQPESPLPEEGEPQGRVLRPANVFYYAAKWFTHLSTNVDMHVLRKYLSHKFVIYDAVERLDEERADFMQIETALAENRNVAYVSTDDPGVFAYKPEKKASYYAQPVNGPQSDLRVVSFNANHLRIRTDFPRPRFLVYNDNYHREWRVSIQGTEGLVVRSNIAFKGVWVPAGEQIIEFKFGLAPTRALYAGLFAGINILLIGIVVMAWQDSKHYRVAKLSNERTATL